MAEDIVFSTSIDPDGKGAKSLKQLRQEFKELQKDLQSTRQGTEEYNKTLQKLGQVRDDIGDLNSAISALNPEGKVQAFANVAGKLAGGFQAATGAAALFGVQSEELEKQLLKVQAASALSQGIQSVVGLGDAFKVLGTVIAANPIMFLATALLGVVAATKLLIDATDEYAESQKRLNEQLSIYEENLKIAVKEEDDRIRKLKLNGATEEEILKERIALAQRQAEVAEDAVKKQLEILNKSNEEERKANYDKYVSLFLQLDDYQMKAKEAQKRYDDFVVKQNQETSKKLADDRIAEANRAAKEVTRLNEEQRRNDALLEWQKYQAEVMSWDEVILPAKTEQANQEVKLKEQSEAKKRQATAFTAAAEAELNRRRIAQAQAELDEQKNYFNAVSDLSATYFNVQLAQARGNAVEEEKIRRRQFQVNKAFAASKAIMDGVNAVQGVLGNSLTYGPLTIPLAISMGVATAANVAKILSQQYNSGVQAGSVGFNAPSGAPQIQTTAPQPVTTPLTRLNEQGQNLSVRAYVVETDITDSQDRVQRLKEQATFG